MTGKARRFALQQPKNAQRLVHFREGRLGLCEVLLHHAGQEAMVVLIQLQYLAECIHVDNGLGEKERSESVRHDRVSGGKVGCTKLLALSATGSDDGGVANGFGLTELFSSAGRDLASSFFGGGTLLDGEGGGRLEMSS